MLNKIKPGIFISRYIVLLLALCLIDVVGLFCGVNLPVAILYGPFIYIIYMYAVNKPAYFSYLHLVPFLLLSFIYIFACFGLLFNVGWIYVLDRVFFACYYMVIPVSLLLYCAALLLHLDKGTAIKKILLFLCGINIVYALMLVMIGMQKLYPSFLGSIPFSLFPLHFFSGISGILLLYYLFMNWQRILNARAGSINDKEILCRSTAEVAGKLKECLEESGLYLNPVLSLEMLAEKMEMPKHHLSYFLNSYIGKTFYQIIAEYRVNYAKRRLEEGTYMTIETLAYECGFNSKTSLNKYFKEITGVPPSQYRLDIK